MVAKRTGGEFKKELKSFTRARLRRRVSKLALFPLLLAAGCVVSGVYGALHDQISFSVRPTTSTN